MLCDAVGLVEAYSIESADAAHLRKLARSGPSRGAVAGEQVVPHRARQLTAQERMAFVERYESGESVSSLAVQFGVHRTTLDVLVRRLGLAREDPRRVPEGVRNEVVRLYSGGMTLAELSVRFGFSANKVQRLLVAAGESVRSRGPKMKGQPLSSEQIRAAIGRYEQGEALGAIAERFGVSYAAVRNVLLDANVRLRARGGSR